MLEGQWYLEELICQALFHYSWWEVKVREVLVAIRTIHQTQGRVVELVNGFTRGFALLELHLCMR